MHNRLCGFKEDPFDFRFKPSFVSSTKSHLRLLGSIKNRLASSTGLIVLSGMAGVGKSTMVKVLLSRLDSTFCCRKLDVGHSSFSDLQKLISDVFGADLEKQSSDFNQLQSTLVSKFLFDGKPAFLCIDNAHKLTLQNLLELDELLSKVNLKGRLLRLLFCGRPELTIFLQKLSLSHGIFENYKAFALEPLNEEETKKYIEYRLAAVSAYGQDFFDPISLKTIVKQSEGVPSRINELCKTVIDSKISETRGDRENPVDIAQTNLKILNKDPEQVSLCGLMDATKQHNFSPIYGEEWEFLKPFMSQKLALDQTFNDLDDASGQKKQCIPALSGNEGFAGKNLISRMFLGVRSIRTYSISILVLLVVVVSAGIAFYLNGTQKLSADPILTTEAYSGKWDAIADESKIWVAKATKSHTSSAPRSSQDEIIDAFSERRKSMVQGLLRKAEQQIERDNLTKPVGICALDLYNEILVLDPDNPEAMAGIDAIKSIYVTRAKIAKDDNKIDKATEYYQIAVSIADDSLRRLRTVRRLREEQVNVFATIVEQQSDGRDEIEKAEKQKTMMAPEALQARNDSSFETATK